ncbi:hypothetical protein ABW20_dc0103046 [Dactylellina cionopaga]|nr:hypothetical protein ABW20_dc0103046 [Dactylellina cionopaga]
MGIPQLLKTLERFQRPETKSFPEALLGNQDGTSASYRPAAVIDGSALAYHILNQYVKTIAKDNKVQGILGFDYVAYQRAVVAWFGELELGFRIEKIMIDGHLPFYKTETRISRMQASITNLSRLHNLSPHTVDLYKIPGWIPTPPFIIAAFSEALLSDERYKSSLAVVNTVPGEADAFCAMAAREIGESLGDKQGEIVVIFTSDSDLVVYPATMNTRVAILNDIVVENTPEGRKVKVSLWAPGKIEERLGAAGHGRGGEAKADTGRILRLAWCLLHEPARVAKLLGGSSKTDLLNNVPVGTEFAAQYTIPMKALSMSSPLPRVILDSRATEVIYSSPRYQGFAHPRSLSRGGTGEVAIYLPVLLEDITKASVWTIGRGIRTIAYKLLFKENTQLVEVHRKGGGVNKTSIDLGNSNNSDKAYLMNPLLGDHDRGQQIPMGMHEYILGVVLEIVAEYEQKGSPLSDGEILAMITTTSTTLSTPSIPESSSGSAPGISVTHWTWPRAQLLAQILAGMWSLYLLQTVVSLPGLEISESLIVPEMVEKIKAIPPLLDIVDSQRFITVYALLSAQEGGYGKSKNAKKRARKRMKIDIGDSATRGVKIVARKMFSDEDWAGFEAVLALIGGMRRAREHAGDEDMEVDEGTNGADVYMGMTVG